MTGVERFKSRVVGFHGIPAPPTSSLWASAGDTVAPPTVSPPQKVAGPGRTVGMGTTPSAPGLLSVGKVAHWAATPTGALYHC